MPSSGTQHHDRAAGGQARRSRRIQAHEEGVSTVLGAILMFGLLVLTLVTIQSQYVPVWDRAREQDHSLALSRQVNTIKADLDKLAQNRSSVPLADLLTLQRPQGFTFFAARPLPGVATFTQTQSGAGMDVSTGRPFTLQQSGGNDLSILAEEWGSWQGSPLTSVQGVAHLRIRIPAPNGLPTGTQTFSLTVLDSAGACAGQLRIAATGTTLVGKNLEAQVFPPASPAQATCAGSALNTRSTYIGSATPAYYYLDALEPDLGFASLLGIASPPFSLSFTGGNTGAQAAIVYDQAGPFGVTRTGGAGVSYPAFNQRMASGTLSAQSFNQRLPAQTYIYEYGAVLLEQPDGAVMASPPAFTIGTTSTQATLAWSYSALTGASNAVAGARGTIVQATPSGTRVDLVGRGSDITVTLATTRGAVWAGFWEERMRFAGLQGTSVASPAPCTVASPAPQYTIAVSATSASLTLTGPCAAPNDTTPDVVVRLQEAPVTMALRPAA